jgi:porin
MSGLYEAISQASVGIPATQFSATQVYPYTQVPQSKAGSFNSTGLVYQKVGANGQLLYNKNGTPTLVASGYIPGYTQNHGFNFQGSPAMNVNTAAIGATSTVGGANAANYGSDGGFNSSGGLYNVNEIGWTPTFGADKSLPGRYALGGYIWGQENTSFQPTSLSNATFTTTTVKGKTTTTTTYAPYNAQTPAATAYNSLQWGLYLQADQRLYAVKEQVQTTSLDSKNPVSTTTKLTEKGLYMFNEASFTPPQNNAMPFYFQTGLVYKGLIPGRDHDSVGIVLGAGFYSSYYNDYLNAQNQSLVKALGSSGNATVPNGPVQSSPNALTGSGATTSTFYGAYAPMFSSTEVIEAYYKIQINKWASVSPDVQYIINPAGNGTLGNEWILGGNIKVTF